MLENIPLSIGLIPDGNRRWARSHRFSIAQAYSRGVKKFIDFSEWCLEKGVKNISVWAFSTENVYREKKEKDALFRIYSRVARDREIIGRLHKNKAALKIVGDRSLIPKSLFERLKKVEAETSKYKERRIFLLIGYGGRNDIVHAAIRIARQHIPFNRINEETFKSFLSSKEIPDMDLVIRTSGELRLSGFLPWQCSYSELYFSPKLWPDFDKRDLEDALLDYSSRTRRFGR
ncbi:MAG: polyprenyl diphosphate synthase [Candidatus Micrarchaeaceae archaeon]